MQQRYANKLNIEYKLFEYDKNYKEYHRWFKNEYPQITSYNVVNFYKIHLMYELSKKSTTSTPTPNEPETFINETSFK